MCTATEVYDFSKPAGFGKDGVPVLSRGFKQHYIFFPGSSVWVPKKKKKKNGHEENLTQYRG